MTHTADSSVVVAALAAWHPRHVEARARLRPVTAVPAHVLVETFSVVTRLPAPHRISAADASAALAGLAWTPLALEPVALAGLVADAGRLGISGGAIYDALIAATAHAHGLTIVTGDTRARRTYEVMGCPYVVL